MAKHKKIFNDIYNAIANGSLKPGDRVPTGNELCEKYGVSRITAVRAMNDLEAQGHIQKTPGKGTFVSGGVKTLPMPLFHLLTPGIKDLFYHQMSRRFVKVLMEQSALGAVMVVQYDLDYLRKTIDCILNTGTRGLVLMHSGRPEQLDGFAEIANSITEVPVMLAQRGLDNFSGPQILVDEIQGGYIATKHLIDLGHERLAYIGLQESFESGLLRFEGFLKACNEAGIPEKNRIVITREDLFAITRIKGIFKAKEAPTAVITPSEDGAYIAYELLSSFEMKIPEEVAIVAIYGNYFSNAATTQFTTVNWPGKEMGETLANTVLKLDKNPDYFSQKDKISYLNPHLIVRSSCGKNQNASRHEIVKHDISDWK